MQSSRFPDDENVLERLGLIQYGTSDIDRSFVRHGSAGYARLPAHHHSLANILDRAFWLSEIPRPGYD